LRSSRPLRGTSREVGHGNWLNALKNMIPADCPYTIRVVSEVLESNGSSLWHSLCWNIINGCLIQMIPVSGIAMGLITDGDRLLFYLIF
jgi:polyribonucleotide nucleotidyltransferase